MTYEHFHQINKYNVDANLDESDKVIWLMNPDQRCLHVKVKNRNEPKPKNQDLSRSLEINVTCIFCTELSTNVIFNETCAYYYFQVCTQTQTTGLRLPADTNCSFSRGNHSGYTQDVSLGYDIQNVSLRIRDPFHTSSYERFCSTNSLSLC